MWCTWDSHYQSENIVPCPQLGADFASEWSWETTAEQLTKMPGALTCAFIYGLVWCKQALDKRHELDKGHNSYLKTQRTFVLQTDKRELRYQGVN